MKKEEKLLRAIGGVDDDLIVDAMEPQKRKKQPAWLRWTAAVACLCLLLASPVGATMLGKLREMVGLDDHMECYSADRFSVEDFSDVAREAAAKQEDLKTFYSMDNTEAAEAFLGLDLPDNAVIDRAEPMMITLDQYKDDILVETFSAPCLVQLTRNDENDLTDAMAWAEYSYDDAQIEIRYIASTDERPMDDSHMIGLQTGDSEREDYVAADGLECVLYTHYVGYAYGAWQARGVAVVDGYLTYVNVYEWSRDEALNCLKSVMDAYG